MVLFAIYTPSFVNYDAQWALLWARDAWHGFLPEYTADFAPTPHPLATAVSSLALPFGGEADIAILWLTLLSFGALVYLTYRLGAELFTPWVGAVAALVVLSRPVILSDALIGYQDLPFAALVVGAVLAEARRHRRGIAVLVLLALAGLLRPEAWVLSGLYWLYLWPAASPRDRVRTAVLAVSAPLIWAGSDWIVTGDPLYVPAEASEEDQARIADELEQALRLLAVLPGAGTLYPHGEVPHGADRCPQIHAPRLLWCLERVQHAGEELEIEGVLRTMFDVRLTEGFKQRI